MGTCSAESADHKHFIASDTKEDHICSSKKMQGDEGLNLNTVECLRGRLLAERQASRVAKEEEESMGNKLVDLEKLLREEIKLRDKAERKLKFLKKKLQSFNKSGQLEHSDSSEKRENSCGSSSVTSSSKYSETKHDAKNSALPENGVHNHNIAPSSTTKDCDSQITDNSSCSYSSPQILSENPNSRSESEDLKNDESRLSNLSTKSSMTDNESDRSDSFDNSLALVPVNMTMTATSQATSHHKHVNLSVFEALDALRLAKERLQTSLETRLMIHIGLI